jgi:hypothetical protein
MIFCFLEKTEGLHKTNGIKHLDLNKSGGRHLFCNGFCGMLKTMDAGADCAPGRNMNATRGGRFLP